MSSPSIERLYSKRINLYHLFFMTILRYDRGVAAFFEQNHYLQNNQRILDAGCGSGTVIKALYRTARKKNLKGLQFYGFDLTPQMLEHFAGWIKTQSAGNIAIIQADVMNPKLPSGWTGVDLIVSSAMLEYLPKDQLIQALKNLRGRMQTHAKIVIFITRQSQMTRWLIGKWWKANGYTLAELETAFKASGFKPPVAKVFPRPYNYLNSWGHILEADH